MLHGPSPRKHAGDAFKTQNHANVLLRVIFLTRVHDLRLRVGVLDEAEPLVSPSGRVLAHVARADSAKCPKDGLDVSLLELIVQTAHVDPVSRSTHK